MFNIGGGEVLVILLVALLVLGPDKLPDAARTAGKMMRQVRDVSQGFQNEVRQAMADVTDDGPADRGPDVHPGAGAGPSLPPTLPTTTGATDAAPVVAPAEPVRPLAADEGTWRTDGPTTSFS